MCRFGSRRARPSLGPGPPVPRRWTRQTVSSPHALGRVAVGRKSTTIQGEMTPANWMATERWFIAGFRMVLDTDHETQTCTTLSRAAKLLSRASGVADIVAVLRTHARAVVGCDGIAVILREGDLCHYVAEDAIEPLWRGQRFPLTDCVSGWAMLHNRSVVIPDLENDPRVPQAAYGRTSMRTIAMVPLGTPEPVAAIGAYWCAFVEPDEAALRRLEILAQVAGDAFTRLSDLAAG